MRAGTRTGACRAGRRTGRCHQGARQVDEATTSMLAGKALRLTGLLYHPART
jgi:hypothetical protein